MIPIRLMSVVVSVADVAQSVKLREAIKEYEANKWKVIGQKVGKPAKVSIEIPACHALNLISIFSDRPASSMPKSISRTSDQHDDTSDEVTILFS